MMFGIGASWKGQPMEQNDFSRVETMSDAELVRWSFLLAEVRQIDERLLNLESGIMPGRRQPDTRLADAQAAVKAEIDRRTEAKGRQA